jgi:hypothetical protein
MMAALRDDLARGERLQSTQASSETFETAWAFLDLVGVSGPSWRAKFHEAVTELSAELDEPRASEGAVYRSVLSVLRAAGKAFELDWKWGTPARLTEEVLSTVVPGFTYEMRRNDHVGHRWHLNYVVMGSEFDAVVDDAIPQDFVDQLNPILAESGGAVLLPYNTGGDSHGFILVPVAAVAEVSSDRYGDILG